MSRDPIRDAGAPLRGEQRGKHESMEMEDRGAGRRPDALVSADDEGPSRLPGHATAAHTALPVPLAEAHVPATTPARDRKDPPPRGGG